MTAIEAPAISAGLYVRISEDRNGTALGVKRQEDDCRELCERRGWTVGRIYSDNDLSAYTGKPRPGYQQLLEDVRAGTVQAVVAWHPDRLYRRPVDLEAFITVVEAAGCRVDTVQAGHLDLSNPSGRMVARMLGATARFESEHKAERQRRKHQELAAAGKDVGGGRPFGYEEDRLTVRESEAELIREAVDKVLDGASIRSIAVDWNRRGISTVTGAPWTTHVVRRMLASARISGRREQRTLANGKRLSIGRITCDSAEWAGIITAEQSDRIRALLSDPNRTVNSARSTYLLTGGMARCGLCGKPLVARPRADRQRSMVCASGPGFHGCGKIRTLAAPLEQLVVEAVLQAVDGGALAAAMRNLDDHDWADDLRQVEEKLSELSRAWAEDQISRVEWEAARKPLTARQEALRSRLTAQSATGGVDVPDALREAWPGLPLAKQRAVLALLIEAVVVGPAVKGRNRFDPERINIRWKG